MTTNVWVVQVSGRVALSLYVWSYAYVTLRMVMCVCNSKNVQVGMSLYEQSSSYVTLRMVTWVCHSTNGHLGVSLYE